MADKDFTFVDMNWLLKGEEDPHPDLVNKKPEELMLADHSHDELANLVFMIGDRSREEDMRMMLEARSTGKKHISTIASLTAAKERIRWLARRVAVLEGRYVGKEDQKSATLEDTQLSTPDLMAEAALEIQLPFLRQVLKIPEGTNPTLIRGILIDGRLGLAPTKVSIVLGDVMTTQYLKRWHLYVEMVRDLLKHHQIYVPFIGEDISRDNTDGTITIVKSKYFPSGFIFRPTIRVQIKETRAFADEESRRSAELIEERAIEIWNSWKHLSGWKEWVQRGNSLMQTEARKQAREQLEAEGKIK